MYISQREVTRTGKKHDTFPKHGTTCPSDAEEYCVITHTRQTCPNSQKLEHSPKQCEIFPSERLHRTTVSGFHENSH